MTQASTNPHFGFTAGDVILITGAGSGLGLAIVRAIAERHHASITLSTAPLGQGLEVRVAFAA